jgi:hypothetical protein
LEEKDDLIKNNTEIIKRLEAEIIDERQNASQRREKLDELNKKLDNIIQNHKEKD